MKQWIDLAAVQVLRVHSIHMELKIVKVAKLVGFTSPTTKTNNVKSLKK